ncbi:MAG: diguanylate cyclase [Betaproteobacteria bacterium]|nr:diguanylate cyclase [Betaproteobacteria bacterium]
MSHRTPALTLVKPEEVAPPQTIEDGWRLYLSWPEVALAIATRDIDQQRAAGRTDDPVDDGWPYLLRALAQCRSMEGPPQPARMRADFQTARDAFALSGDARGRRLARLENAAIAMRLADWPLALAEFEALIGEFDLNQLDADNFYLCFGLATSYVYMGRLEESLRFGYAGLHLARQLELLPEIATITMPLGVALLAAKDPEESDALNETAIEVAARIGSAGLAKVLRNNRAVALRRLGRLDEALALLGEVLASPASMVGGQHFVHFNAAELYLKREEIDDAERHFVEARHLLAARGAVGLDLIKLHYIAGAIARSRGQLAAALSEFAIVDRMLPDVSALRFNDRAEFYDEYADVLSRADRPGEAFEMQRKSSRQYQVSLGVVNRVRRFSMQVRQEIHRVNAELARASDEQRKLQQANRRLRGEIERAIREADLLRDKASHDELTGVFNRAYLDATLPGLLTLSVQSATPLALVMIDLDHFKRINDRHGHAAGDEVLRRFGRNARSALRGSDLVSRYGGEEFCLALIGCGADAARQRVERLMTALRGEEFSPEFTQLGPVTFSAGIAVYPEDGVHVSDLLRTADARLLRAKRQGRVQIVCGGAEPRPA